MRFKQILRIIIHLIVFTLLGFLMLWIIPYPATVGARIFYILLAVGFTVLYEVLDYYGLISEHWFKS